MNTKNTDKKIQYYIPEKLRIAPELLEVQKLMPISDDDRDRLKKDIEKSGEIRDPLKVYMDKDYEYYILTGATRHSIALELGLETVPIEVIEIKSTKARQEFAINDNLNRRHLTRDQKEALIKHFLKKNPKQSNRSIANKTGTDRRTVALVRGKSGGTNAPPEKQDNRVVGMDGKKYPVRPAIAQKPEKSDKEIYVEKAHKAIDVVLFHVRDIDGESKKLIQYIHKKTAELKKG